ncbi:protein FATTY ACID EXPORT 6-like [Apium graveolens]|uniref:protein FATTY ACID EXPORT 6-like n=1 Tax=Apium graveolens TaxID=4045 RepID=UPI003D793965
MLVACGGITGFIKNGSTASLGGGLGIGLLLILAGYLSLNAFHKLANSFFAFILETVCATALTWIMGQHYAETSKIMSAGIVAGIRCIFVEPVFLELHATAIYGVVVGGNWGGGL